jgi:DnaJ-class molecular chaperone
MKRITEYRNFLNATAQSDLKELKSLYRNVMKEWHPDKFTDEAKKAEAEEKSTLLIEAYHFLVNISPETHEKNVDQYNATIASGIEHYEYKRQTLTVNFIDGSVYEYYAVTKNVYNKLLSSNTELRYARRHIFNSFTYRRATKEAAKA